MTQQELLARQLDEARDWTLKLIADLDGDDWFFQPAPGMAHPLWLCGHLASAQSSLIHVRCLKRQSVLDEAFQKHFGHGVPVASATAHDFPPAGEVRRWMDEVHEATLVAVRGVTDELLAEPCFGPDGKTPHPHYTDKAGAISHCSRHEAFHAGQIASIRRLLGKPFLR